ncbi:MAG TPA: hypothetical protein VIJ41_16550 [Candidatus Nanopelagicales bacterium]
MGLREHQIGKGTLGYKGETAEYFESKRGLWDHFRWLLAAICLVLGVAFLVASASPVVAARVVSVTDDGAAGTNTVVLVAPNGATAAVTVAYADTPAVGASEQATQLPGGRLILGDHSAQGRGAALIFLALGGGIVLRAAWRIRHPRPRQTTVLVPDDTYALPPH